MSRKRTAKRYIYTLVPGGFLGLGLFFLPVLIPIFVLCQQISKATKQVFVAQSLNLTWMGPSVLEGIELKADEGAAPWVKSRRLSVDLGLWQALASGSEGVCLDVSGGEMEISFDAKGFIKTRFPMAGGPGGKLPMVRVNDALFRLTQEGHPPLEIKGIQGELTPDETGYDLDLTSSDPDWGIPKVKGRLALVPKFALDLHLEAGDIPMNPAKLKSIPFVPTAVWETVELSGQTPLVLDLKIHPELPVPVEYKVAVKPHGVDVHIPVAQLKADQAMGAIRVENGKVIFDKVEGNAFGGKIRLPEGAFAFSPERRSLDLNLEVEAFSLKSLPQSWGDPTIWKLVPVDAKITGDAKIGLTWTDTQPLRAGGGGKGKIYATLLGFTQSEWQIRLQSFGNRFLVIPNLSRLPLPLPLPGLRK